MFDNSTPPIRVVAPVASAWTSKINWTQLAGPAATALAYFGLSGIDANTLLAIFAGVQGLQSVVTIVMRTFFTKTITPSSAAALPPR